MAEHPMKHGTLLQTISGQGIYIECRECGHTSTLKVADMLGYLGNQATVKDVLDRIKCSKCRKKSPGEVRIVSDGDGEQHNAL
jgi:phage terminase large subunit GpA-like protein